MKKYTVKYTTTYNGTIEVLAESKTEAKEIVKNGFGGLIVDIGKSSYLSNDKNEEGIIDWNFPIHSDDIKIS